MKYIICFFLAALFLASCNYSQPKYDKAGEFDFEEASPSMNEPGQEGSLQTDDLEYYSDKKIIKDASIGVEVEDFEEYTNYLDSLIKKLKGYISSDNLIKNEYYIRSDITIRIPSGNFEQFIDGLEYGTESLQYKNISARDVTEEFIDIEARLKTKKEVEKRYIQLLSKAINIKEILEVEEKLRVIREEIESVEGRLKYLKSQVSFSTINLSITQNFEYRYQPKKSKNFFQRLVKSLDKGWKGLIVFILFLFRIWPFLLIVAAIIYYIRYIKRKKKSKQESTDLKEQK